MVGYSFLFRKQNISINKLQKIFGSNSEKRKKKKSGHDQNKTDNTSPY
jgi:hypothetical protein